MVLPVLNVVCLMIVLLSGFLLQILGIYCCCKEKNRLKNQRIILLNLSAVEVLLILFMMVQLCGGHISMSEDAAMKANKGMFTIYHGLIVLFYNTMILIPLDRLVCILSPTKYTIRIHKSTLQNFVLWMWILSLASVAPFPFLNMTVERQLRIIHCYSYILQAVFVVVSITTYGLLGLIIVRRNKQFEEQPRMCIEHWRIMRTFRVPLAIICTFVVFYMIPNFVGSSPEPWVETVRLGVSYVGLSIDPIIYILLHRILRPIVVELAHEHVWCLRRKKEVDKDEECVVVDADDVLHHSCIFSRAKRFTRMETCTSDPQICTNTDPLSEDYSQIDIKTKGIGLLQVSTNVSSDSPKNLSAGGPEDIAKKRCSILNCSSPINRLKNDYIPTDKSNSTCSNIASVDHEQTNLTASDCRPARSKSFNCRDVTPGKLNCTKSRSTTLFDCTTANKKVIDQIKSHSEKFDFIDIDHTCTKDNDKSFCTISNQGVPSYTKNKPLNDCKYPLKESTYDCSAQSLCSYTDSNSELSAKQLPRRTSRVEQLIDIACNSVSRIGKATYAKLLSKDTFLEEKYKETTV